MSRKSNHVTQDNFRIISTNMWPIRSCNWSWMHWQCTKSGMENQEFWLLARLQARQKGTKVPKRSWLSSSTNLFKWIVQGQIVWQAKYKWHHRCYVHSGRQWLWTSNWNNSDLGMQKRLHSLQKWDKYSGDSLQTYWWHQGNICAIGWLSNLKVLKR